jgi:hypothetical protein
MKVQFVLSKYYKTFKDERMEIVDCSIISSVNSTQSFFSLLCEP